MNLDQATNIDPKVGTPGAESLPRAGENPPSQPMDPAWLLGLLQAGDSFYPTGSYAHSFGLEGFVQQDVVRDRATLRAFLLGSALPALRHVDLPLAAHAWRSLAEPDWTRLRRVAVLSSALRPSREARIATENIGRQRADLVVALHASPLAAELVRRATAEAWPISSPIAAALEGRVLGAPLPAVLANVSYASLAALVAAAMKVLRLGQNAAQSLLAEMLAAMPDLIAAAQSTPLDEVGWFNPWLDIASARHETADARMFIS